MATLKQIRQKMLEMQPTLGSLEGIASGSTTTVVVTRLATGGISPQRYVNRWILRPDTATTADRVRRVTNFASSTGTLTHAGTNYSDTTFTSENVEIWEVTPQMVDNAIAYAVGTIRFLDLDLIPGSPNRHEYDLAPFDWIQEEDDVLAFGVRRSPIVSRNRGFEKWNTYATTLDHWTLAGSGATIARSTSPKTGRYAVTLTRSGTNCTLTQTVGLQDIGVSADSLRGQTLQLVLVASGSTAAVCRAAVADGTQTVTTSAHSGSGTWEELTEDITVSSSATTLTIEVQINTSDAAFTIDQCYLALGASVSDTMRRDQYDQMPMNNDEWKWLGGRRVWILDAIGRGTQLLVWSQRPVPTFAASRIAAGTADTDDVDVPVETAAIAALARLYRTLSSRDREVTTRYQQLAGYWEAQRDQAQAKILTLPFEPNRGFGINWTPPTFGPAVRR